MRNSTQKRLYKKRRHFRRFSENKTLIHHIMIVNIVTDLNGQCGTDKRAIRTCINRMFTSEGLL